MSAADERWFRHWKREVMRMQSLKKLIVRSLAAVGALVLVGMILGLGCLLMSRED